MLHTVNLFSYSISFRLILLRNPRNKSNGRQLVVHSERSAKIKQKSWVNLSWSKGSSSSNISECQDGEFEETKVNSKGVHDEVTHVCKEQHTECKFR